MRPSPSILFVLALACGSQSAFAQTGVLDQVSPFPAGGSSASYNYDAPSLVWQQQVRAGLGGQLEGFELTLGGTVGSTFGVQRQLGAGQRRVRRDPVLRRHLGWHRARRW